MERNDNSVLTSLGELRRIETSRVEQEENARREAELQQREAERAAERRRIEAAEQAAREEQARIAREQQHEQQRQQQERLHLIEAERRARVEAELALEQQRIELLRNQPPRRRPWLPIASLTVAFIGAVAVAAWHRGEQIDRAGAEQIARDHKMRKPLPTFSPRTVSVETKKTFVPPKLADAKPSPAPKPPKPRPRLPKGTKKPPVLHLCNNNDPLCGLLKKAGDPFKSH